MAWFVGFFLIALGWSALTPVNQDPRCVASDKRPAAIWRRGVQDDGG
jgi:hypothetical protein